MGYKNEIYNKAFSIKREMIKASESAYENALSTLREKNTEFVNIEQEISKIGPAVAISAISGDSLEFETLKKQSEELNARYKEILKNEKISKPDCFCHLCEDSGYVNGQLCNCIKDIAKNIITEKLSRYMPLGDCRFDNFNLKYYSDKDDEKGDNPRAYALTAFDAAKRFADEFPSDHRSLLIMGSTGLGKTHLCLSIVSKVTEKGFSVIYGPAGKLFSEVEKEHFSYSGETNKLDSILECDLLVIDDLGTEFLSPFIASLLYNIINSRILEKRPTVISTNLDIDEIEKRYTERIASRLMGNYDSKLIIGSDIRQQKAYGI